MGYTVTGLLCYKYLLVLLGYTMSGLLCYKKHVGSVGLYQVAPVILQKPCWVCWIIYHVRPAMLQIPCWFCWIIPSCTCYGTTMLGLLYNKYHVRPVLLGYTMSGLFCWVIPYWLCYVAHALLALLCGLIASHAKEPADQ